MTLESLADTHVVEPQSLGAVVGQQSLKAIEGGIQVQHLGVTTGLVRFNLLDQRVGAAVRDANLGRWGGTSRRCWSWPLDDRGGSHTLLLGGRRLDFLVVLITAIIR